MSNWSISVCGFLGTCIAAWILVRLWIGISLRARILDVPTHRSSHVHVTPRGGGVGIVAASLGSMALVSVVTRIDRADVLWLSGTGLFIAAVSFWDDLRSLPSVVRLVCHIAAAAAMVKSFGAFGVLSLPITGALHLSPWFASVLTITWVVGITNVFNFMDGIDGIAGGQGVVAGLAWTIYGFVAGDPLVHWFGLALAAGCGGFLFLNWSPARVFMGDVGSAYLGFCFGVMPLLALRNQGSDNPGSQLAGLVPLFAVLVVWPFVADGILTFLRRVRRRENVLEAHRSHLYQRLTIVGWRHAPVASMYIVWALVSALLAWGYSLGNSVIRGLSLAAAVASVIAVYFIVKLAERSAVAVGPLRVFPTRAPGDHAAEQR